MIKVPRQQWFWWSMRNNSLASDGLLIDKNNSHSEPNWHCYQSGEAVKTSTSSSKGHELEDESNPRWSILQPNNRISLCYCSDTALECSTINAMICISFVLPHNAISCWSWKARERRAVRAQAAAVPAIPANDQTSYWLSVQLHQKELHKHFSKEANIPD